MFVDLQRRMGENGWGSARPTYGYSRGVATLSEPPPPPAASTVVLRPLWPADFFLGTIRKELPSI